MHYFFIVKTTRRIPKPRTKQCFEGIRGKEKAMQQESHDDILLPPLSLPDFSKQPKGNSISMLVTFELLPNMVNKFFFFFFLHYQFKLNFGFN
jgi:hypothetical protein